eukprot:1190236-Prorocentrum_minimum.AAC.2
MIASFYGSSCANNSKGGLNTPEKQRYLILSYRSFTTSKVHLLPRHHRLVVVAVATHLPILPAGVALVALLPVALRHRRRQLVVVVLPVRVLVPPVPFGALDVHVSLDPHLPLQLLVQKVHLVVVRVRAKAVLPARGQLLARLVRRVLCVAEGRRLLRLLLWRKRRDERKVYKFKVYTIRCTIQYTIRYTQENSYNTRYCRVERTVSIPDGITEADTVRSTLQYRAL